MVIRVVSLPNRRATTTMLELQRETKREEQASGAGHQTHSGEMSNVRIPIWNEIQGTSHKIMMRLCGNLIWGFKIAAENYCHWILKSWSRNLLWKEEPSFWNQFQLFKKLVWNAINKLQCNVSCKSFNDNFLKTKSRFLHNAVFFKCSLQAETLNVSSIVWKIDKTWINSIRFSTNLTFWARIYQL